MALSPLTAGQPGRSSLADIGFDVLCLLKQAQTHEAASWPTASFVNEAERFELWAVNLGLFVAGHGSLDYRVREAASLAETIRRFLHELRGSLEEGEPVPIWSHLQLR